MALQAVPLARFLSGGAPHAHLIMSNGQKYTTSGPTQQINTIHEVQLRHRGGDVQQAQQKIILVKAEGYLSQMHRWQ